MSYQVPIAPGGEETQSQRASAEDVPNDDRDLAVRNRSAFAQLEVQLCFRFPDVIDIRSRRIPLRQAQDHQIDELLKTIEPEELVQFESIRTSDCRYPLAKKLSWFFSAVSRQFVEFLQRATALNKSYEKLYRLNDIAQNKISQKIHHANMDDLYDLLSSRTCDREGETHSALMRVPGHSDDGHSFDMYLSVCPRADENEDGPWHKVKIKSTGRERQADIQDICSRARQARNVGRRLCLSFDRSMIWSGGRDTELINLDRTEHQPVSLRDGLGELSEKERLKLAVDLVRSLSHLYPGPWTQIPNPTVVHFVRVLEADQQVGCGKVYLCCDLWQDWTERNDTWRSFQDPANLQSSEDFQDIGNAMELFFISVGEFLVRIRRAGTDWVALDTGHTDRPIQERLAALKREIKRLSEYDELENYVASLRGCLGFKFDYNEERRSCGGCGSEREAIRIAQGIFEANILEKLEGYHRLWATNTLVAGPNTQSQAAAFDVDDNRRYQASGPIDSYYRLFADEDKNFDNVGTPDRCTRTFIELMRNFKVNFVQKSIKSGERHPKPTPIRIAVIDTGFDSEDDPFFFDNGHRVDSNSSKDFSNSEGSGSGEWNIDNPGHGTHVVRLLLRFTANAEIVVVKITDHNHLARVRMHQLIEALEYAGKHADIINLSLGMEASNEDKMKLGPVIDKLVESGKLIFAAASNSGPNGYRAFPASHRGVFAIHALRGDGSNAETINPPLDLRKDNFATLGVGIPSWSKPRQKDILIEGTSFATPIAAAIAANLLTFIQEAKMEYQPEPKKFFEYKEMQQLLQCFAGPTGSSLYSYVRPWKDNMFGTHISIEEMQKWLQEYRLYGTQWTDRLRTQSGS